MQINCVFRKLQEETGLYFSRSKLYHYDRKGLLGDIGRDEQGYRSFTDLDYERIKTVIILADIGVDADTIKATLDGKKDIVKHLHRKKNNISRVIDTLRAK